MPTHVALLRGINVGVQTRVAMSDLREIVTSLGHQDVATYIQSGNVVFTSPSADPARLADDLEAAISARLGISPAVVVLSREDLAGAVAANPYPQAAGPKLLHAVFRREEMNDEQVAAVAAAEQRARDKGSPDEATVVGRTLYLHTPGGLGRSELAAQLSRTGQAMSPGGGGTARNWATVTRLMAMLED
ncbi:MAG TPA: DUF1697 domain-containing protein [Streptosporangiaceae bacterium]|nr:DUF1697 domain-containing protein [Streptosporangiaceae bacterium]